MCKITLICFFVLCTSGITLSASTTDCLITNVVLFLITGSNTLLSTVIAVSPFQKHEQITDKLGNSEIIYQQQGNNLEKFKRNRRGSWADYEYDEPNLKTINGFLQNLVVLLDKDKITTLKADNLKPEYQLFLQHENTDAGGINGISISSNEARFVPKEVIPLKEDLSHSHRTEIIAGNVNEDKVQSASYSEAISDSFTLKFGEKISVKAGFKIQMLATFEATGELSAEQSWTTTKTKTLTAPPQMTTVKANHKKEITYSIFKGESLTKGVLKTKINPELNINTFFTKNGRDPCYKRYFTIQELIDAIKKIEGNSNLFNSNAIISEEGGDIFLNVPCELTSESSRLTITLGNEIPL